LLGSLLKKSAPELASHETAVDLAALLRHQDARLTDVQNGIGAQLAILDSRLVPLQQRLLQFDRDLQWVRGALAASVRTLPPNDLRHFESRVYSQNGEDGIIEEIFRRIRTTNRYFVEFGVETGGECNAAHLALDKGWSGLFLEADPDLFYHLQRRFSAHSRIRCQQAIVTSENIESLLEEADVPLELDLLAIDVDGNDYWIWKAITHWSPRVVVIEYNGSHRPDVRWVMKENLDHRWCGNTYYGASLASLNALARTKGYTLVGTNTLGVNAFFVRNDLVAPELFLDPAVHYHYSPATHGPYPGGHPPADGPHLEI